MVITVVGIIRAHNLFAVVMLGSVYSFLMATVMVILDAVDVSMTEAAVGAGMSTVLLLAVLHLTKTREAPLRHKPYIPLFVCLLTGGALVYARWTCRPSARPTRRRNQHVAPYYIENAEHETHSPNIVTRRAGQLSRL